jgi:hypothetical protein
LKAGLGRIALRGFDACRISDVAKAIGKSSSLVLHHFEDKDPFVAQFIAWLFG